MTVEGCVCWAARSVGDAAELRRGLAAWLPSGKRPRRRARGGTAGGDGSAPAGIGRRPPVRRPERARDGRRDRCHRRLQRAARRSRDGQPSGAATRGRRRPGGFEATPPTVDRFDRSYHTVNVAREYPSGATVELDYRSRDPSRPDGRRPNVSDAILWLCGDVATAHDCRTEWTERTDGDGTGSGT